MNVCFMNLMRTPEMRETMLKCKLDNPTKSPISLLAMTFESSKKHQLIAIRMLYCQVVRYTTKHMGKQPKYKLFVDGHSLLV